MVVTPRARATRTEATPGPDGAVVGVYDARALTTARPARSPLPRPTAVERAVPGRHVIVGRRGSLDDPLSAPDGDGVRVTVEQTQDPLTSRRHLELVHRDGRWMLQVLGTARHGAHTRWWGHFNWSEAPPGTCLPLEPGRPLAVRLPGRPTSVVTVVTRALPTPKPAATGRGDSTTGAEPELPTIELTRTEQEAVARIYRPALQWPPAAGDDPLPSWVQLPNDDALRQALSRLRSRARDILQLAETKGPDARILTRLIASRSLTYAQVGEIAEACDLSLDPPQLW